MCYAIINRCYCTVLLTYELDGLDFYPFANPFSCCIVELTFV